MKAAIARREFLKRATRDLAFLGIGSAVFDTILSRFFARAVAETLGTSLNPAGYYIHFTMRGGPPRWLFDLPLTPNGKTASNFIEGGFGTIIDKTGGEHKAVYAVDKHTVGGETIYLPPVWKFNLDNQKFADILRHTVFIRGIDMEINNHTLSNSRQVAPIIGSYSLSGVVADDSDRPMPAIIDPSSPAASAFRSKKGLSTSSIGYGANPVAALLTPFKDYMAGRAAHSPQANLLTGQAFAEFEKMAKARGVTSTTLPQAYDSAMELMEKNIYSLSSEWAPTFNKYKAIVKEAMQPKKGSLDGIFDSKIQGGTLPQYAYERNGERVQLGDLRNMVTGETSAPNMAENFAIAEILLDKVTSNMVLSLRDPSGFDNGSKSLMTITHDQHFIGSVVSTLTTTLFYRAFLGCLTEFTSELKQKKLFDRTVMHISSEFNRAPRADLSGSDHAFMGSNATLISGMIKKNGVVGNIQKAGTSAEYPGTFGVAADFDLDGMNRPIQVNDVARTISSMLGVADIVTNGRSLLAPSGKNWILRKAEAKNV